jgi:cell division protein FtsB
MAERRRQQTRAAYATNGSAAYDNNYWERTNAAPLRQPHPELPEERQPIARPRPVHVRGKLTLSPFAVVGFAMVAVLLFMMISAYVRLYETTADVASLNSTLSDLQDEQAILTTRYESKIDLAYIEETAQTELGMVKPESSQTIYVNLSGPDVAEVITTDKSETARTIWQAFSESVSDLLNDLRSYFG